MRRVVVTGMGIVSSIGNSTQEVLASLREAKSGVTRADKHVELGFRSQVHGAPTLDPTEAVDRLAMELLGWRAIAHERASACLDAQRRLGAGRLRAFGETLQRGTGELYRKPVAWISVGAPGRGAGAERVPADEPRADQLGLGVHAGYRPQGWLPWLRRRLGDRDDEHRPRDEEGEHDRVAGEVHDEGV